MGGDSFSVGIVRHNIVSWKFGRFDGDRGCEIARIDTTTVWHPL